MGQYIVSARKYRPDSFESLIGQDNIAKTLKNSILRGQLAHAYLFCGPRGVGKTSAARIFAKMINCEYPTEDMEPCGQCESCVSFTEGRSYCIHELDAASNNGVEDIKALMDQVQVPPQVGKYSVYIIDEVHMLSQQAFNAFLKTLEEPPAHAIFILATTEKHKILPTILSRCQTYDFNRISIPDIVHNLRNIASIEKVNIDDESLHIIAQKADGAMRDALTIFDQTVAFCGTDVKYDEVLKNLNVLDFEYSFALIEDFLTGNWQDAMLKFDEVLSKGFNALHFVGSLSSHFRNLIVAKSGGLDSLLELPDSLKNRYAQQAAKCHLKFLYDALSCSMNCENGYKASLNPRLHIEFALMKLSNLTAQQAVASAQPQQEAAPAQTPQRVAARPQQAPVQQAPVQQVTTAAPATPQTGAQTAIPAAKEQPQPEQSARRRPAKTAASLSLASIDNAKEEIVSEAVAAKSESGNLPSDEVILKAWQTLPELYSARPRLAMTLKSAKVEIVEVEDGKELHFFVLNKSQKEWIEEKLLRELQGQIYAALKTIRVKLICDVLPDEQVEAVPYTPKEKVTRMMKTNEEVKNLVIDLGLDV